MFQEHPSRGRLVILCGRTDRHRDKTNQLVAFRNSVKAPKYYSSNRGLEFPACLRRQI